MAKRSKKARRPAAVDVGSRIQACRESAGLTREQLADKAGMHSLRLWRLENGKQKVLVEDVAKIAAALELSVVDVLGDGARA